MRISTMQPQTCLSLRFSGVMVILFGSAFAVLILVQSDSVSQALPTPIQVQIVTSTLPPLNQPTPTPTFTPTEAVQGAAVLEVKEGAGEINVRQEPSTEAEIVGKISYGTEYVITGRYFLWYRFRYEDAPNGVGWVFGELVDVFGDVSLVEDLSAEPPPTTDTTALATTATAEILLLTPDAVLTITANARELEGPVAVGSESETAGDESIPANALPTFTPLPELAALSMADDGAPIKIAPTPIPIRAAAAAPSRVIPPIVPILLLGGFGLLGLVVSAMRR